MIADYFTKPLQGELVYKFRDQILGVVPMETIVGDHRSVLDHNSTKALAGHSRLRRNVYQDTYTIVLNLPPANF
jgi:hypothetical protein